MTAVKKLCTPLSRIDDLLGLALRHHESGKVRNLLGGDGNDGIFARIGGGDDVHAEGTREGSPDVTMALVDQLRALQLECRATIEELEDVEAAGKVQLATLTEEVYAHREAEQRAAIEADRVNANLSQGLLYVDGVPLVDKLTAVANPAATFFEGTSFNDSMLDNLGLFLTKLPATASPLESKGDLYRPTTQDYEEMQELRWVPSEVALADANAAIMIDEYSRNIPTKIQVGLIADTVMHKPLNNDDKEYAIKEQGAYCKGCLAPLKKSFNLFKAWDHVHFCFYTGYLYCESCFKKKTVSPLPALIVKEWDFTPKPISEPAQDFLEVYMDSPIICISAINPLLYQKVPILDAARKLRVEINALHSIGVHCKTYRHQFFECGLASRKRVSSLAFGGGSGSGSTSSSVSNGSMSGMPSMRRESRMGGSVGGGGGGGVGPRAGEYETYVPLGQRYLSMDSEVWSMSDLIALHQADPSNSFKMPDNWGATSQFLSSNPTSNGGKGAKGSTAGALESGGGNGASINFTAGTFGTAANRPRRKSIVQPYPGNAHPLDKLAPICPLIRQLLEMRKQFLRHVVKECVDRCMPRAVHVCPACQQSGGSDLVFAFDQHNRYYCRGCHNCYHTGCWAELGQLQGSAGAPTCPVCFTIASKKKKKGGAAAAVKAK